MIALGFVPKTTVFALASLALLIPTAHAEGYSSAGLVCVEDARPADGVRLELKLTRNGDGTYDVVRTVTGSWNPETKVDTLASLLPCQSAESDARVVACHRTRIGEETINSGFSSKKGKELSVGGSGMEFERDYLEIEVYSSNLDAASRHRWSHRFDLDGCKAL